MMNTQWTAQDVERYREQQRWRLRQKSHMKQQQPPHAPRPSPPSEYGNNEQETTERTRKVSLKFRREHQQFLAKGEPNPHLSALAVTMRPAFTIATPFSKQRESPLPHMGHSMFNAFDSTASPEAFALERASNQDEENQQSLRVETQRATEDHDMDMANDGEEDHHGQQREGEHVGSLWRRRFHVPGIERRSPKLGEVALWDAHSTGNNHLMRLPLKGEVLHPFALNYEDDL